MPSYLKLIISVLALLLCTVVYVLDDSSGASRWIALALGPLMVFSIWVFPEAKADDVRKHAARRRV
jgi:cell division protein FtsW (lipid II flippase)